MSENHVPSGRRADRSPPAGVHDPRKWVPSTGAMVLLVSASTRLQDEVARITAAAALVLSVAASLEDAGEDWERAAAVLVGVEIDGALRRPGPVIMVGLSQDSVRLWHRAVESGADRVAVLPEASEWLAEFLGRLRDPGSAGFVLGIVGGCGGAGASTLAVLLAAHASSRGVRTLLVDGDEWGGGLDLAVAAETVSGIRWPDLLAVTGTISPVQLAASLPVAAGFSLLSWGQHRPTDRVRARAGMGAGGIGAEVLKASRRAYELSVVDVGRSRDGLAALGQHCDQLLAVAPVRLRCAVATAQLLGGLPALPVSLVVRGPMRDGLDADLVADSVGVPLAGVMPALRSVAAATERGQLPDLARNRRVRRLADSVLGSLKVRVP